MLHFCVQNSSYFHQVSVPQGYQKGLVCSLLKKFNYLLFMTQLSFKGFVSGVRLKFILYKCV